MPLFQSECKAPAKRSQHFNATYRNIVGRNMLRAFGHHVAMCCDMLSVVDSNLKLLEIFRQHFWMLHVVDVWPAFILDPRALVFSCAREKSSGVENGLDCEQSLSFPSIFRAIEGTSRERTSDEW